MQVFNKIIDILPLFFLYGSVLQYNEPYLSERDCTRTYYSKRQLVPVPFIPLDSDAFLKHMAERQTLDQPAHAPADIRRASSLARRALSSLLCDLIPRWAA
jgi:hypothetical protein